MNLNELIAEYEKFLDQMAECEWESKELFQYRTGVFCFPRQ